MQAGDYGQTIRRCLALVWRSSRSYFLITVGLTTVVGLLPTVAIFINARLVALLAGGSSRAGSGASLFRTVVLLIGLTWLVMALATALGRLRETARRLMQRKVSAHLQLSIVEVAAQVPLADFENPEFHNRLQRVSADAGSRPLAVAEALVQSFCGLANLVSLAWVLTLWHWWIVPLLLVFPVLEIRIAGRFAAETLEFTQKRTALDRRAYYLRYLLTSDWSAKEIRAFDTHRMLLKRLGALWQELYHADAALARRRLMIRPLCDALLTIDRCLLLGLAAAETLAGKLSFGAFALQSQALVAMGTNLKTIAAGISAVHEHHLFLAEVFEVLDTPLPPDETAGDTGAEPFGPLHLEFRDVCFSYPNNPKLALNSLSFRAVGGERIALVGENGAGKSTLIKLLLGFYTPTSGSILINGRDIRTLPAATVRKLFTVMLQESAVYHLPVTENILMAENETAADGSRARSAAEATGLAAIVGALPRGFDTILGKSYDPAGHELSGGQRQLVGLSRALARNTPVLVLDEPTSALDLEREGKVLETVLQSGSAEKLLLIVSHRPAAARLASRILVIAGGRVAEDGDHESLIKSKGVYERMHRNALAVGKTAGCA